MLIHMLHNSEELCAFIDQLEMQLSQPQRRLEPVDWHYELWRAANAGHATKDKYIVVVLLAWAYVERRFASERSPQIKTYGDIIRRHRDEHAVDWLTGALHMLQDTGDIQQVLQRFLRLQLSPA